MTEIDTVRARMTADALAVLPTARTLIYDLAGALDAARAVVDGGRTQAAEALGLADDPAGPPLLGEALKRLAEQNRAADGAAIDLAERLDAAERHAADLRTDTRQASAELERIRPALIEAERQRDTANAALVAVEADLADERRRHTGSRETVTRLHGLLVEAERRRDEALAAHRAAGDDRDHARQTAIALWQENAILAKAVAGDSITLKRAAAASERPAPDPWAQLAQLRAALEAFRDSWFHTLAADKIRSILAAAFPPDGQDQAACEHAGDRGIGEPGRCWDCGAWFVDVVPTGWALTTPELDEAIAAASGFVGVYEVGEEARDRARALFDAMAEQMVRLGARRTAADR